jgi:hypothetical protein
MYTTPLLQSAVAEAQLALPHHLLCCSLFAVHALLGCPAASLAGCAGPADNKSTQHCNTSSYASRSYRSVACIWAVQACMPTH